MEIIGQNTITNEGKFAIIAFYKPQFNPVVYTSCNLIIFETEFNADALDEEGNEDVKVVDNHDFMKGTLLPDLHRYMSTGAVSKDLYEFMEDDLELEDLPDLFEVMSFANLQGFFNIRPLSTEIDIDDLLDNPDGGVINV